MTPGIALLVIGGILLVSGWTGSSIVDVFAGRRKPGGSFLGDDLDSGAGVGGTVGTGVTDKPAGPLGPGGLAGFLQLPKSFESTHETSGLSGYPAIDVFAKPGTQVLSPVTGEVDRLSGQAGGPASGGPYGYSVYIKSPDGRYFLTHFGSVAVKVGEQVLRGKTVLGTVADYPDRDDHIHEGYNPQ